MSKLRRFVSELRRRRVFRTAGIYLIGAWLLVQVASTTFAPLGLPDWSVSFLLWVVLIGFPLALVLGWRYELGPKGISLTVPAKSEAVELSLKPTDYLILTLVAGVVAVIAFSVVDRVSDPLSQRAIAASGVPRESDMVAVLPFVIEDTDTTDEYMIQGLSDELRNRLSGLPGVPVAGRSSSEFFRNSSADPVTIAESLGVATLIEGRVRTIDNIMSVSLEITDGRTGRYLWGGRFDRPVDDLLVLQQEIIRAVVQEVAPHVEAVATSTGPATDNPEAHDNFLLARYYDQQVRDNQIIDVEKMYEAMRLYQKAIDADPNLVEAYAGLANALLFLGLADEATRPILAAEALDRNSSEVQYTLATYRMAQRLPGIKEAFEAAIALNPNNADALEDYAVYLWHQGDNTGPEELILRAIELDPLVLFRYNRVGHLYAWNGRVDDALEVAATVERLFPNDEGCMLLARIHELVGALDEAIVWALRAKKANPTRPDINWQLAELYARLGDFETAYRYEPETEESIQKLYWQRRYRDLIDLGEEQIFDPERIELTTFYLVAFSHNVLGEFAEAVYLYEDAVDSFAGAGMPEIATHDSHLAVSTEHLVHYAEALQGVGREEDARSAAQWIVDFMDLHYETGNTIDWWATTYQVCALLVLGENDRALDLLVRVKDSPGLPWYPLLEDSPCFQSVKEDPRYLGVIANVEGRMAAIRTRLPQTLATAGFEAVARVP